MVEDKSTMTVTAYLALGGNMGDPLAMLAVAAERIAAIPGIVLRRSSRRYLTEPVGPPQPPYVNQILELEVQPEFTPSALLEALLAVERHCGRIREAESRWGPRPIDIDLLLFGEIISDDERLKLPHRELSTRAFVLVPLTEIAPELREPQTGRSYRNILSQLAARSDPWSWVRPLPDEDALAIDQLRIGAAWAVAPTCCDDKHRVRQIVAGWRRYGLTIGFVPTMGFLHEGHLSLMRIARARCDRVVVSIFVNPIQFSEHEDLDCYPRDLASDLTGCARAGVDLVMTSTSEAMYPTGYSTYVSEVTLGESLCGASRPGHFRGVTTVVAKLFNIVQPDLAFFGLKDAQQAAIIGRMVRDLEFGVQIVPLPIVRERDGLAMSSRNAYLTTELRTLALRLVCSLQAAARAFTAGERSATQLEAVARAVIAADGHTVRIDYVQVVSTANFHPVTLAAPGDLLAMAVFVGSTRLIDNHVLGEPLAVNLASAS
jgi:pantoate--beta-alanine ligase